MPHSSFTHQKNEDISKQAAEWLVLLDDDANEELQKEFLQWLAQSPKHQAAIERMQKFLSDTQSIAAHPIDQMASKHIIHQALQEQKKTSAHFKHSILGIATVSATIIFCALLYAPMNYWTADQRNSSQSWRNHILQDHSQIQMSGKTAFNIEYSAQQRKIKLLEGNILVDVRKDKARPFIVETQHGTVQALGTRFIVTEDDEKTIVTMLESKTAAWAKQYPQHQMIITSGQRLELNDQGFISSQPTSINANLLEQAWQQKNLIANNENLVDVLDYLAMHYTGKIIFDRAALSDIRVTATLPLDNIDIALQQLATELHLNVQQPMPYIRKIEQH